MKRFLTIFCFILLLICPFSAMSAGPENMFVWDDFNYFFSKYHTWTGTQTFGTVDINGGSIAVDDVLANETLGGVSTFVITGNLTITDPLMLSGRPIEINATSSPYIDLPALALSSVTPQIIFQDVTKAGNDSGVTIRSTANYIHSGIGSTYTSGGTIFCNTGNTGFMLVLKALNYGSGVTPSWRVVSFSGDTLRRP